MILADASAWLEYDRGTGSAVDRRMAALIAADGPLAVTEPVVVEVLAGARDDRQEHDLRRLLRRFALLHYESRVLESGSDFDAAVRIYRRYRRAGDNATRIDRLHDRRRRLASRGRAVARDTDLDRVARVVGIDHDEPTSRSSRVRGDCCNDTPATTRQRQPRGSREPGSAAAQPAEARY